MENLNAEQIIKALEWAIEKEFCSNCLCTAYGESIVEFYKEIPHVIAIVINEFYKKPSGTYEINLDIICEKQNHKAILIGKQGEAIKRVSKYAREGMEKFLNAKVFLTTYVKVKENWGDKENLLAEYGYGDVDKSL